MVRNQNISLMTAVTVVVVAMLAASSASMGDFVVTYPFPSHSLAPVVTGDDAAAVSAGNASLAGSFGTSGAGNIYTYSNTITQSEADALASNSYVQFTVGPTGDAVAFDSLSVDFYVQQGSGTLYIVSQSSVGGLGAGHPVLTVSPSSAGSTWVTGVVDLSNVAFDNVTESITFQFRFYDNEAIDNQIFRMDNIVLTGGLVPEPTSMALIGVGGLLAMRRRRSRRA